MRKNKPRKALLLILSVMILFVVIIIAAQEYIGKKDDIINKETQKEEAALKREIGNVIAENNASIVIENSMGEKYILEKLSYPGFTTGDRVMLSYYEREKQSDGTYKVIPILLDHMRIEPEIAGD